MEIAKCGLVIGIMSTTVIQAVLHTKLCLNADIVVTIFIRRYTMYDYGNEISELLAEGWDYEEAVEYCEFVCGEMEE